MVEKNEVIELIKDLFSDEDELDKIYKYIECNNDKEKAESIKKDVYKLLNHNNNNLNIYI